MKVKVCLYEVEIDCKDVMKALQNKGMVVEIKQWTVARIVRRIFLVYYPEHGLQYCMPDYGRCASPYDYLCRNISQVIEKCKSEEGGD